MSNRHHQLGTQERPNDRIRRGKLSIIHKKCKKCGHEKAWDTINKTKCTRCGEISRG